LNPGLPDWFGALAITLAAFPATMIARHRTEQEKRRPDEETAFLT